MADPRTTDELDRFLQAGAGAGLRGPNAMAGQRDPAVADLRGPLSVWLDDLRRVADRPPPTPRGELAHLLATGRSPEQGDGPPNCRTTEWRSHEMIGTTGLFSGLVGKLTGLGVPAKALMALGVTATVLTGAGAATGALPGPAQSAVATVVNAVSPLDIPTGDDDGSVVAGVSLAGGPGGEGSAQLDAGASAGSSSAGVDAAVPAGDGGATSGRGSAGGAAAGTTPDLSAAPVPGLPDLPGIPADILDNLPIDVPDCATTIVDPATGRLLVPPDQLTAKVLDCARSMVPAGTLPPSLTQCLTSVLGSLQGVLGAGVPSGVSSADLTTCAPVDGSPCVTSVLGAVGADPTALLGSLGSLTDLGKLLDVDLLDGCVPVDATRCVSSILDSFRSGNVENIHLDLSACLPTS